MQHFLCSQFAVGRRGVQCVAACGNQVPRLCGWRALSVQTQRFPLCSHWDSLPPPRTLSSPSHSLNSAAHQWGVSPRPDLYQRLGLATSQGRRTFASSRGATDSPTGPNALKATDASVWPLLRSLWPSDVGHNLRIGFAFTGLVVGKALAIYAPLQLGHLVDSLGAGVEVLPVGLLAAYGLARLSTSLLSELRSALFASVSQAACRQLARRAFEHLQGLDAAYLLANKPGALSVVVSRATQSLTQVLNTLLFNLLPIGVEVIMALAVMTTLAGPLCSTWSAATIGVYIAFTRYYSDKRRGIMRSRNKAEEEASGLFFDSLVNCEVVKYFQAEKREVGRYDAALSKFESKQVEVLQSLAMLNFGQQFIIIGGFTGVLGITAAQVMAGSLPVGDVVAIHGILAQLMQPLGILGGVYRITTQGFVDLGKLVNFLETTSAVPPPPGGGSCLDFKGGKLEFRDIHLAHGTNEILRGASLVVPSGSRTAIVGRSGSGKSTLLRLLYRLQDPDKGQVLIDGQDIRDLDPTSFRSHLGIVPQDCALFNENIGFNIRYGRPDATDEDIEKVVKLAQLDDLLAAMPQGLKTPVGERGLMLSGGERQRVGIARALLKDPSIVLLDEATSSLDVRTERHLVAAIDELISQRTCLIVAHRLSTVERCDLVAFLDNGTILEQGSHQELMASSERYRQFWHGQGEDGSGSG